MQVNNKDLLAKLLAVENLQVVRAPVSTASFDIKSRTLVLPRWKDMSESVEDMLIAHEVGHALFTDMEYMEAENFASLKGYLNVIEDVRIERKMKDKYPGLRKSFTLGYKELNDKDFFGVSAQPLHSLLLIDRINLYYKAGFNCGVKFTPVEFEFVSRASKVDTIKEVAALAQEIWDYTKAQLLEKKKQREENKTEEDLEEEVEEELSQRSNNFDDIEDSEDFWNEDGDEDDDLVDEIESPAMEHPSVDDEEETQNVISSTKFQEPTEETVEEQMQSKTARVLRKRLEELADLNTIIRNYVADYHSLQDRSKIIVPYKYLYDSMSQQLNDALENNENVSASDKLRMVRERKTKAQTFKDENTRIVNYLVKEFEMRKSASEYVRTQESRSGQLNTNKLAVHKFSDDIFKRISEVAEDKNHGMIFLVDWSGSMCDYIDDTIRQVVILAMFCQKIQIPYHVYAFTDGFRYPESEHVDDYRSIRTSSEDVFQIYNTNLLEFFSHKMTNAEFNRAVEFMLNRPYYFKNYGLNGTPFNESLFFLLDELGNFKSKNNLQKVHLITLTDGDANGALPRSGMHSTHYDYDTCKRHNVINYINDPMTKKQYRIHDNRMDQTPILLKILKDRYDCRTIGFYIGKSTNRHIYGFLNNNTNIDDVVLKWALVDQIKNDCRKHDFSIVPGTGRDEFYYLPTSKLKIEDEQLEVSKDMTSAQIAKAFNKYLNIQKTNRVLLNRFVGMIV